MKAFLAFIASVLISFSAFAAKENNEKLIEKNLKHKKELNINLTINIQR